MVKGAPNQQSGCVRFTLVSYLVTFSFFLHQSPVLPGLLPLFRGGLRNPCRTGNEVGKPLKNLQGSGWSRVVEGR